MDDSKAAHRVGERRVAFVVFLVLGVIYALTLAPGLTWWDAGELALAADRFGIPHPPGTPLYVLLARSWHLLLPGVSTVLATNMLSAVASAAGCAVLGAWLARSLNDKSAGVAAGIAAGAMTSIWRNATETEVYALVFLAVALVLAAADAAGRTRDARWRLLTMYALALGYALHPALLVVAPAALVLAWPTARSPQGGAVTNGGLAARWHEPLAAVALVLLALSALAMLVLRAPHDPWLNQGNPASLDAWRDVLGRTQYGGAGVWPRQSAWWAQLGMVMQYLDWQFALGASPSTVPTWPRAMLSALALVVLVHGARWHWRRDRRTAVAVGALLVAGTLGAAVALNFRTGWSFSLGHLLDGAVREVRERDYFFSFGFAACGLWYGLGLRALALRFGGPTAHRARSLMVAGVLAPVLLNWPATTRRTSEAGLPRAFAQRVLHEVAPNGVFIATGDNELYPLWYLQGVEGLRPDVLVVAEPLLPTQWYRAELARRSGLALGDEWPGAPAMRSRLLAEAARRGRPVFDAVYADPRRLETLWSRGGLLVGGHAEPFSRVVAALLREKRVLHELSGSR